jgi:hypothetical protein
MFVEGLNYDHEWSMDCSHAKLVGRIVEAVKPKHIVEVGCFLGVSTAYILRASLTVRPETITLIDINIRPEVFAMVEAASKEGLGVLPVIGSSRDELDHFTKNPETLALLDGDHSLGAVMSEVATVLRNDVRNVILHDATNFSPDCRGANWAMHSLQQEGYYCLLDCLPDTRERTHRGLAFLTKDRDTFDSVRSQAFFPP